jgi:hypothetical protein
MEKVWRDLGTWGRAIFWVLLLLAIGMFLLRIIGRSKITGLNTVARDSQHLVQTGSITG